MLIELGWLVPVEELSLSAPAYESIYVKSIKKFSMTNDEGMIGSRWQGVVLYRVF